MKRIVLLLVMVVCALGVAPRRATAQCHEVCTFIFSPDGKVIGRGCVYDLDSPTSCLATARFCFTGDCGNAVVVDANGRLLAEADICRDKVTLRSIASAPAAKVTAKASRAPKRHGLAHVAPRFRGAV